MLLSITGLGPAIFGFHMTMDDIGIILSLILSIFVVYLYIQTIDIWGFFYLKNPNSKNLEDLMYKTGG